MCSANFSTAQNVCIDSSFTRGFKFPGNIGTTSIRTTTLDNGFLFLNLELDNTGKESNIIYKTIADGNLDWNLKLTCKDNQQTFHISNLLQLKNGEFIIAGNTNYNNYSKPDKVFLIKISPIGNIIWQKQLNNNNGSLITENVRVENVQEGYNGDIIVNTFDRNVAWNLLNLTRLNSSGQVIWSNAYFGYAFLFKSNENITANDGALHTWGIGEANCSIWNEGLKYIKFNNDTGFPENTKTYCVEAASDPIRFSRAPPSIGNIDGKITKKLNNGNTVVFLQDYASNKHLLISLFDSNYNYIKSSVYFVSLENTDSTKSSFWYDVNPKNGDIIFGFNLYKFGGNANNPYSFIFYLDDNLKLQQQKYFQHPTQKFGYSYGRFFSDGSINITGGFKTLLNTLPFYYLNYSKTLLGATNDAYCNARDTVYGSFEPHTLQYGSTKIAYDSVKTSVYQSVDSSIFNLSTINISDSMECLKISICDSLKIIGPNTICLNIEDTVVYSFYKNAACLKEVEWKIDTAFAKFVKFNNDTAIGIKFKKAGRVLLIARLKGCSITDTLRVNIIAPKTELKIAANNALCPGTTKTIFASKGFANYQWNAGGISDSLNITSPGLYQITATDSCGNIFKDSIIINLINTQFNFPQVTEICNFDTLFITLPIALVNINWQPIGNVYREERKLKFFPNTNTNYNLQLEFVNNCFVNRSFQLKVLECPETIFFPTAFTPNNDGLNDVFKPVISKPLTQYYFAIYNRLGQKIFETTNQQLGWNGILKGIPQNSGSFVWVCKYKFAQKPFQQQKGSFSLIR